MIFLTSAIFLIAWAWPEPAFGVGIDKMVGGPIKVTKGDVVILTAEVSKGARSVEWWSEGRVVCAKISCEIDTSAFTPGEYRYEIVVTDNDGVALASVAVRAHDALPLYIPKTIRPIAEPPKSNYVVIGLNEWLVVPRAGVIAVKSEISGKVTTLSTPSKVNKDSVYTVVSGSQAIVRQMGSSGQWLVSAPSSFRLRGSMFELLSGQAMIRQMKSNRLPDDGSPPRSTSVIGRVKVQNNGSTLIFFELKPSRNSRMKMIISNIAGGDVVLNCGPRDKAIVGRAEARHIEIDSNGVCVPTPDLIEPIGDFGSWVASWAPWWIGGGDPSAADRWRIESQLWNQKLPGLTMQKLGENALKTHSCPDFLDRMSGAVTRVVEADGERTARGAVELDPAELERMVGDCFFDMGLYRTALNQFKSMEQRAQLPEWTSYMLGQCYQALGQPELALWHYEMAEKRGFSDLSRLGRSAAQAAFSSGDPRGRLRWLETAAIYEADQAQKKQDWMAAGDWRSNRYRGGSVEGRFFMDGQALPVNSKKTRAMPSGARTSRSTVYQLSGVWWSRKPITGDTLFEVRGQHNLSRPHAPSLDIGTKSIHEIATILLMGDSKRLTWNVGAGLRLGTGISGSERQRDLFAWNVAVSQPQWLGFYFELDSAKYLDPAPGGADSLDLDLDRFTESGDHSHIDLKASVGSRRQGSLGSIDLRLTYGSVDYRTGSLDRFDHTVANVEANAAWPLSYRTVIVIAPRYLSRRFKAQGGADSSSCLDVGVRVRTGPLWTASLYGFYEARKVTSDESLTYSRQGYGASLGVDL